MAKILDLIYRVKDTASLPIKRIKTEQDGFNTSLKQGKEIATASVAALTGVFVATGKLISAYQDYTISVGDMAAATGVSTEEMSALMEMSGDLGIATDSLVMAFRKMAKEGIDPSIEGLIQVRGMLDGAATDADRMALAQKYLGRSATDLMPIFDQLTNEQLRNFVTTMSEAQIVTQAEYDAAVDARAALQEWNDAYQTITLSAGGFLTKGLLPYLKIAMAIPDIFRRSALAVAGFYAEVFNLSDEVKEGIRQQQLDFEEKQRTVGAIERDLIPAVEDYIGVLETIPTQINTNLSISTGGGGGNWGGTIGGQSGGGTGMPGTPGNEIDLSMPGGLGFAASQGQELTRLLKTLPTLIADAVERGKA